MLFTAHLAMKSIEDLSEIFMLLLLVAYMVAFTVKSFPEVSDQEMNKQKLILKKTTNKLKLQRSHQGSQISGLVKSHQIS